MHNNSEQDKQERAAVRDKDRLMFTLPNTGSTWFAALLAKHLPGCNYYDKEFFNPVCNLKHSQTLIRNFGSELACCYANIAKDGDDDIRDDIEMTWGSEDYTFTKETYCAFKVRRFTDKFMCFVFLRTEENCFPPRRARVYSFYEHAWQALNMRGFMLEGETLYEKMIAAHRFLEKQLVREAARHGLPVLWWEDLFGTTAKITDMLYRATGLHLPKAVEEIESSRQVFKRGLA